MLKYILLTAAVSLALSATAAELDFDFGQYPVGQCPPGFASLVNGRGKPGDWQVIEEDVPPLLASLLPNAHLNPAKRPVLAQLSQDFTDEHFPILLFTNEVFGDFTLTTRFKTVRGVMEQMAGIVFRAQDENNYYVFRASTLGNNYRFYKVVGGLRSDPMGPALEISKDTWHELKVECDGNRIHCFLDGNSVTPAKSITGETNDVALIDNTFLRGKIGYWTKSDSVCYFVDTHIHYTPLIPFIQGVVADILKEYPRLLGVQVYAFKNSSTPILIADRDEKHLGTPGTSVDSDVIRTGTIYFSKDKGSVEVELPLRDRNGEAAAALKVTLKSFKGETQDTAIARALIVKKAMQERVETVEQITQ